MGRSISNSAVGVPAERSRSLIMVVDALEWAGSLLGLLGAFLLATHTRVSRYGWLAFLAANLAMIGFAIGIGRYGLLLQQTGFMFTSLLGIYRAGFLRVERSKP